MLQTLQHSLKRRKMETKENAKLPKRLTKLLASDTENTLLGKPFLRSQIDWAEEYQKHLAGPNASSLFEPTSGTEQCSCAACFYRDAPPPHNPQRDCQMCSSHPKKFFGFPKKKFMPAQIAGKDLGHYCPYWTSPNAE